MEEAPLAESRLLCLPGAGTSAIRRGYLSCLTEKMHPEGLPLLKPLVWYRTEHSPCIAQGLNQDLQLHSAALVQTDLQSRVRPIGTEHLYA